MIPQVFSKPQPVTTPEFLLNSCPWKVKICTPHYNWTTSNMLDVLVSTKQKSVQLLLVVHLRFIYLSLLVCYAAGQACIFCCCTFFFFLLTPELIDDNRLSNSPPILYQQWGPGWTHKISTDIPPILPPLLRRQNYPKFWPKFWPQ